VEIYSTEEQQEQAIKQFLKDNGFSLLIGAVVGLGSIWGWNYYQKEQLNSIAQNSIEFSKVAKSDDVVAQAESFVASHDDTQYSHLAQLLLVKSLVEKKDYDKATTILKDVIASDVESAVKSVATVRLARLELATGKADAAISTLSTLSDKAFAVIQHELSGDAYLVKGQLEQAREAYLAAVDAAGEQVSNDLQMKLDDLTPAA